ncbi:hypothetical protein ACFQ36_04955 [Arthrobacter sp. GCM10027362]|uniref:hypothetical protein n=1 Tax=Arthrobacter sp. GCM10027362 TaxID=3273379 RepID=UPI00363C85AD
MKRQKSPLANLAETKKSGVDDLILIAAPASGPVEETVRELGKEVAPFPWTTSRAGGGTGGCTASLRT